MIYLIEYDRPRAKLVRFRAYPKAKQAVAEEERLRLELDLNSRAVTREVVLLEAKSKRALRKTHRRYFESTEQIAKAFVRAAR